MPFMKLRSLSGRCWAAWVSSWRVLPFGLALVLGRYGAAEAHAWIEGEQLHG